MNNELLIERENIRNEILNISHTERILEKFLEEYESYFTEKDSIEALKKMKDYLMILKQKNESLYEKTSENSKKIRESCLHEVLMETKGTLNVYGCAICGKQIKQEKVDFPCLILKTENGIDGHEACDIYDAIEQVFMSDENIFETFEDHLENEEVRIYRRIK